MTSSGLRPAPLDVTDDVAGNAAAEGPVPPLGAALFAASPVAAAVLDAERRFVDVNPALCRMLGVRRNWLLTRGMADLVDTAGADDDRMLRASAAAAPTGSASSTTRIRRADGRWLIVEHAVGVLRDGRGRRCATVSQFVDVTEVRARQRQVEADHARLKATLASLLDPHVLLQAIRDAAGRIIDFAYADANDAACAYMGLTADEMVGATVLELLPGHAASGMLDYYVHAVETGEPLHLDGFRYDNELVGHDRRYDIRGVRVGDGLSFTWRDVTERYETAAELAASEARFRLLAQNSSDVVMHIRNEVTAWVSPSVRLATGWAPDDWIGHEVAEFVHPDDWQQLIAARDAIEAGESSLLRMRVRDRAGRYHWIENHGRPYYDESGHQDGIVASWRIVDVHVAAEEELVRRAHYDDLTGLFNRTRGLELLGVALAAHAAGGALAVAFCDVDHFKAINDHFGHAAGDELLRTVAARIRASVGPDAVVARLGGDELLVVLDGVDDGCAASAAADAIRRVVAEPIDTGAGTIAATLSIGVTISRPGDVIEDLLQRADAAMYAAKRGGRDRLAVLDGPSGNVR